MELLVDRDPEEARQLFDPVLERIMVELAVTHYQQALALDEELGMHPLQAHCHWGLGTLYATTGQREQVRTALSTALTLYRDMNMTFWLPQTEAALAG